MVSLLLVVAYVALVAYLPLLLVTCVTVSKEKLSDITFVRALSKDYLRTVPVVALVTLPVLVYPRMAKAYVVLLHLVFALPLLLEIGHVYLFKTRVGLNTFYSLFVSNARETREFFEQNVSWLQRISILLFWLVPPFFLSLIPTPSMPSCLVYAAVCVAAAALALPFVLNLFKGARAKDGYLLNPYSNLIWHYLRFHSQYRLLKDLIARHSAPPFAGIRSLLPEEEAQTYVVVIGESSNSMHQHYCGYWRETNEFTDRLGSELIRFKGVRSPFAQTIPVLEKAITFADCEHPDRVWTMGSVVDYFKDAGFETYWMSNQYALDDTALTAMIAHADFKKCYNFSGMKRFEKAGLDGALLPDFERFIHAGKKRKVLFLHLIGSHSAYVNRYPDEFRYFTGPIKGRSLSSSAERMVNVYDDSVRYTDWVVSELIARLKAVGSSSYLLYFSDHGEDIYDSCDNRILGHSELANEPMTSIPLMLWTSPRLDDLRPDIRIRAMNPKKSYNLQDVIHTILDVSSLRNSDYDAEKSILPA